MREQKYSHWRKQLTDIQGERKRVDEGLKWKVSTVDIRIKKSGLKFNYSKVFSSGSIVYNWSTRPFTDSGIFKDPVDEKYKILKNILNS